ncbi:MAG: hypothetical protein HQM14_11860 [SAR324 cluster bacterium]|nr:hypothetical protein [SAR324 cluster bacterium]
MQTKEIVNIPLHEEIEFFRPLLKSTRKLIDELENSQFQRDTEPLECHYAPVKGKQRQLDDIHLVREEWILFRNYFMGKTPLLYFMEPPLRGLVNKDAALWLFSKPECLQMLGAREQFKINEFSPNAVRKLPFQNIEHHFQSELSLMLTDTSKVYSLRAQECEKYLKLAAEYLPKKQTMELHQLVRILLKIGLKREIEDLQRILGDKSILADQAVLKKRMRAVHTLAMKYYFARAGDEQKSKIDSLVGRDKGFQKQALDYIGRIMARSFKASVQKK